MRRDFHSDSATPTCQPQPAHATSKSVHRNRALDAAKPSTTSPKSRSCATCTPTATTHPGPIVNPARSTHNNNRSQRSHVLLLVELVERRVVRWLSDIVMVRHRRPHTYNDTARAQSVVAVARKCVLGGSSRRAVRRRPTGSPFVILAGTLPGAVTSSRNRPAPKDRTIRRNGIARRRPPQLGSEEGTEGN